MTRRKALTSISPNPVIKPRKRTAYGKRARPSYKDRASILFDAVVAKETQKSTKRIKRRVTFSDPLTEEIPDTPFSGPIKPRTEGITTQHFEEQSVNRVLSFDSDDEKEQVIPPPSSCRLPSPIDEAKRRFQKENDPEWYPETLPDDVCTIDEGPTDSLADENGPLLFV